MVAVAVGLTVVLQDAAINAPTTHAASPSR
jgi:hypothetical protein